MRRGRTPGDSGSPVDRIGPLIGRRMPFESVLIRVIDLERNRVETLVRAPLREVTDESLKVADARDAPLDRLLAWWRKGRAAGATIGRDGETTTATGARAAPVGGRGFVRTTPFRCAHAGHCCAVVGSTRPLSARARIVTFGTAGAALGGPGERPSYPRVDGGFREAAEADKRSLLVPVRPVRHCRFNCRRHETGLKEIMGQVELSWRARIRPC